MPSELSKTNSTDARFTGLRAAEPLKITSSMLSPRNVFAEDSPITQRIASMTFDFPQPFGPTIPTRLLGTATLVVSTNDLNPDSFICLSRIHFPMAIPCMSMYSNSEANKLIKDDKLVTLTA